MSDKKIKAYLKKAGEPSVHAMHIYDDDRVLKALVEGELKIDYVKELKCCMLSNKNAESLFMPHNFWLNGRDICGNAAFVGLDGDDFVDCELQIFDLLEWLVEREGEYGDKNTN